MSMLYYWLAFCLGMVFYAAYLSQSFLLAQGMIYMKETDRSPSLLWLFTRLLGFILRTIPSLPMNPLDPLGPGSGLDGAIQLRTISNRNAATASLRPSLSGSNAHPNFPEPAPTSQVCCVGQSIPHPLPALH
jgi:hypothetical protein